MTYEDLMNLIDVYGDAGETVGDFQSVRNANISNALYKEFADELEKILNPLDI